MYPLADYERVQEILRIEIPHWRNDGTNFTSLLLTLIQKADPSNRAKLAQAYPAEVEALRRWETYREVLPEVPAHGTVVVAHKNFASVEQGMKGVIYEHYDRARFGEKGAGVSILFQNGFYDGFSLGDLDTFHVEITGRVISSLRDYVFLDVRTLMSDHHNGHFSEAFINSH